MLSGEVHSAQYFGKLIGKLSELHHGVSGEVYAVDSRTLYIKDFTYDGQGPGEILIVFVVDFPFYFITFRLEVHVIKMK